MGRIQTGPLPRLPERALSRVKTLEAAAIPGLFISAIVALVAVQLLLAW